MGNPLTSTPIASHGELSAVMVAQPSRTSPASVSASYSASICENVMVEKLGVGLVLRVDLRERDGREALPGLADLGLDRAELGECGLAQPAQLVEGDVGNVDVEHEVRRHLALEHPGDDLGGDAGCRAELGRTGRREREREAGTGEGRARQRGAHGAGVQDRMAGVRPVVDAREDESGRWSERPGQGRHDDEGGARLDAEDALDTVDPGFRLVDDEASVLLESSQGRARPAALLVRGGDGDLEPCMDGHLGQGVEARAVDPVVIGHECPHRRVSPF